MMMMRAMALLSLVACGTSTPEDEEPEGPRYLGMHEFENCAHESFAPMAADEPSPFGFTAEDVVPLLRSRSAPVQRIMGLDVAVNLVASFRLTGEVGLATYDLSSDLDCPRGEWLELAGELVIEGDIEGFAIRDEQELVLMTQDADPDEVRWLGLAWAQPPATVDEGLVELFRGQMDAERAQAPASTFEWILAPGWTEPGWATAMEGTIVNEVYFPLHGEYSSYRHVGTLDLGVPDDDVAPGSE